MLRLLPLLLLLTACAGTRPEPLATQEPTISRAALETGKTVLGAAVDAALTVWWLK